MGFFRIFHLIAILVTLYFRQRNEILAVFFDELIYLKRGTTINQKIAELIWMTIFNWINVLSAINYPIIVFHHLSEFIITDKTVKNFEEIWEKFELGDDIALLLLSKPINVCDAREPNVDERFGIIRLPLGNSFRSRWTDHDVEFSKCTMYGYGRSESELFECADFIASIGRSHW